MTALPPAGDVLDLPHEINAKSLYKIVLKAEDAAKTAAFDNRLMYSRVLGYLILHPPGNVARTHVLKEIASCNQHHGDSDEDLNNALYELGKHYVDHLLSLFRRVGGRTPASSDPESLPSFDRVRDHIQEPLQQSPQDHRAAKALIRDGFRCMATSKIDYNSFEKYTDIRQECIEHSLGVAVTQCCHIFPEFPYEFFSIADHKHKNYTATVWTILSQFGYPKLQEELMGHLIHRLDNIMTLRVDLHHLMDTMKLWFEKVEGEENTYIVHLISRDPVRVMKGMKIPSKVKFVACSEQFLPLPNPTYLKVHAACCRIAHLSGVAKYLEQIFSDMEELSVLAEDGGSADVLSYALQHLTTPVQ